MRSVVLVRSNCIKIVFRVRYCYEPASVMRRLSLNRSEPAKKGGQNIPKNRCRTTIPERMVETRAELPFIGDQVVCLGHDQPPAAYPRLRAGARRCVVLIRRRGSCSHHGGTLRDVGRFCHAERHHIGPPGASLRRDHWRGRRHAVPPSRSIVRNGGHQYALRDAARDNSTAPMRSLS